MTVIFCFKFWTVTSFLLRVIKTVIFNVLWHFKKWPSFHIWYRHHGHMWPMCYLYTITNAGDQGKRNVGIPARQQYSTKWLLQISLDYIITHALTLTLNPINNSLNYKESTSRVRLLNWTRMIIIPTYNKLGRQVRALPYQKLQG